MGARLQNSSHFARIFRKLEGMTANAGKFLLYTPEIETNPGQRTRGKRTNQDGKSWIVGPKIQPCLSIILSSKPLKAHPQTKFWARDLGTTRK
jgi:hypothetical protein